MLSVVSVNNGRYLLGKGDGSDESFIQRLRQPKLLEEAKLFNPESYLLMTSLRELTRF